MRAARIEASRFRNLASLDAELPAGGVVFLGQNGQGKTNLLELLYYPVLFRSLRGVRDVDLVQHGQPGFHLRVTVAGAGVSRTIEAGFLTAGRRKRVAVDGTPPLRVTDALGVWLAVAFLPADVGLISGGAADRRLYLDRTLGLASPDYLRALRQYRAALAQRNAALRRGLAEAAWAFDPLLARYGSTLVQMRLAWVETAGPEWASGCAALGEPMAVTMGYRGKRELADPAGWSEVLVGSRQRDLNTGVTGVGPQRDDLTFRLGDAPLRVVGSTGQQRTAAIALKLCERDTLRRAAGREPALLLDDVFAELDRDRQERLAERLELTSGRAQVFITAPRVDELPPGLSLPVVQVAGGEIARLGAVTG